MPLIAKCPHCQTIFRIADAFLTAPHDGIVRCGVCKQVFDANDRALEQAELDTIPPLPDVPRTPRVNTSSIALPEAPAAASPQRAAVAPRAVSSKEDKPPSPAAQAFLKKAQRKRIVAGIRQVAYLIASIVLAISLFAQSVYMWRHEIAAAFPATKPWLQAACNRLGCHVGVTMDIHALSLESYEMHALPATPDLYTMSLVLRNNSKLPQEWPHIELALNNATEKTIIRKVFTPEEYLPADLSKHDGFASGTEFSLEKHFRLLVKGVAGYHIYLFYP